MSVKFVTDANIDSKLSVFPPWGLYNEKELLVNEYNTSSLCLSLSLQKLLTKLRPEQAPKEIAGL